MSAGNGSIPIIGHRPALKKDNDLITVRECRAIVADECTKVHEYYLNQIPAFVANMIMDGLVHHGLITDPRPETVAVTEEALTEHGLVAQNEAPAHMPGLDAPPSDGDEMPVVNPS